MVQSSAAGFYTQQSLPTGFMSLVWDMAGELPTYTLAVLHCCLWVTPSAAELGKSVTQSLGLPPHCLGGQRPGRAWDMNLESLGHPGAGLCCFQ